MQRRYARRVRVRGHLGRAVGCDAAACPASKQASHRGSVSPDLPPWQTASKACSCHPPLPPPRCPPRAFRSPPIRTRTHTIEVRKPLLTVPYQNFFAVNEFGTGHSLSGNCTLSVQEPNDARSRSSLLRGFRRCQRAAPSPPTAPRWGIYQPVVRAAQCRPP